MVSNVTMGTNVRCLPCLNNAADTAFLHNTIKVVELVLYKPTSFVYEYTSQQTVHAFSLSLRVSCLCLSHFLSLGSVMTRKLL